MKILPFAFSLLATAAISAFAQSPSSLAGQTLTFSYFPFDVHSPEIYACVDFDGSGNYRKRVEVYLEAPVGSSVAYFSPSTGTYSYQLNSDGTGTLTLTEDTDLLPSNSMIFTGPNIGYFGIIEGSSRAPFVLDTTSTAGQSPALINVSLLTFVGGGTPATMGFVIGGTKPLRAVMIRAVGPSLAPWGISNFTANPTYNLTNAPYSGPGGTRSWSADQGEAAMITEESTRVGAFPLLSGSSDKADIYFLSPGAYTISTNASGSNDSGVELIEVYELN